MYMILPNNLLQSLPFTSNKQSNALVRNLKDELLMVMISECYMSRRNPFYDPGPSTALNSESVSISPISRFPSSKLRMRKQCQAEWLWEYTQGYLESALFLRPQETAGQAG